MSSEDAPKGLRRTPQQSRSQESTDRMLDAALAIIAREGMAGLNIAAVSHESGVSNGALYHRFGDRQGLLVAAQDRFLSMVENDWVTVAAPLRSLHDPEKLLTRLTQAYLQLFSERRALFQAFMITEWADADLRARGAQTTKTAANLIVGLLTERFDCTPEAADTAYRVIFGQAMLLVFSTEEDTSFLRVEPRERVRHLVRGLRAVLQP
jgi:AcrR family transcriptional regulator